MDFDQNLILTLTWDGLTMQVSNNEVSILWVIPCEAKTQAWGSFFFILNSTWNQQNQIYLIELNWDIDLVVRKGGPPKQEKGATTGRFRQRMNWGTAQRPRRWTRIIFKLLCIMQTLAEVKCNIMTLEMATPASLSNWIKVHIRLLFFFLLKSKFPWPCMLEDTGLFRTLNHAKVLYSAFFFLKWACLWY